MSNLTVSNSSKSLTNPQDIQVLKDSLFKGFTDPEINFCSAVFNQLGLSPLLRQIHFVKRFDNKLKRDVITPQTGIDGFRLIADRTGKYAGSDEPNFEYKDADTEKKNPIKASVTVFKIVAGMRVAFTASARWDEFYPGSTLGFMWHSKPHVMLGKCAEAQALRKAFPAELSSVYADEELQHVDSGPSKASRIHETIMSGKSGKTTTAKDVTPMSNIEQDVPPFDQFQEQLNPMTALEKYIIPVGEKFKGRELGEVEPDEFKKWLIDAKAWHITEKKPISASWKELFDKASEFLGIVI
jgi:phage recombination protein Bet